MQQINFTGNLSKPGEKAILFLTEEGKEVILDFFTRNCESIAILFCFNIVSI